MILCLHLGAGAGVTGVCHHALLHMALGSSTQTLHSAGSGSWLRVGLYDQHSIMLFFSAIFFNRRGAPSSGPQSYSLYLYNEP